MTWRRWHVGLAVVTVAGTVAHAMLIEGAMGAISKALFCALLLAAAAKLVVDLWSRNLLGRRKA